MFGIRRCVSVFLDPIGTENNDQQQQNDSCGTEADIFPLFAKSYPRNISGLVSAQKCECVVPHDASHPPLPYLLIGAQIEKTTNHEAMRDLSGRRQRDITNENRIKDYVSKEADRYDNKISRNGSCELLVSAGNQGLQKVA